MRSQGWGVWQQSCTLSGARAPQEGLNEVGRNRE